MTFTSSLLAISPAFNFPTKFFIDMVNGLCPRNTTMHALFPLFPLHSPSLSCSLPQVAFDPLDGSSVVGANFAVGSIFGVWPGATMVGSTGRHQAAAAYAVYGPRTVLVWARPKQGEH